MALMIFTLALYQSEAQGEDPVDFADPLLQAAVEEKLQVLDPTPTDMLDLTGLVSVGTHSNQGEGKGISSLDGLEYATNLDFINMRFNLIDDISPLADLLNLTDLNLSRNQISDLSPLGDLVNLTDLNMHGNGISDIGPLSYLTALQYLDLHWNDITDLSALEELVALDTLNLFNNPDFQDLSPLSGLNRLDSLDLENTRVTDVSALLQFSQLSSLDLKGTDLGEAAYASHLQEIVENNPGIRLVYDSNPILPDQVVASQGTQQGGVQLSWNSVPNGPNYTSYYRVYRSSPDNDQKVPVSPWQTTLDFVDASAEGATQYTYWIRLAIDAEGLEATGFGAGATGWADPLWLTISTTAGGTVTTSKALTHIEQGDTVAITATPSDAALFSFAGWSGTAVESGNVHAPTLEATSVTLDAFYDLKAHFVTRLSTLHVDGDVLGDPNENGTPEHPFDSIQEAIDVAPPELSIYVHAGIYREHITLAGQGLTLVGLPSPSQSFPVIQGIHEEPLILFSQDNDLHCRVDGFVLTRGRHPMASAVLCVDSSPTLENCLMVGNETVPGASAGGVIYGINSRPTLTNCTIADNRVAPSGAAITLIDSSVTLSNSILWNSGGRPISLLGASQTNIRYSNIQNPGTLALGSGFWIPQSGNLRVAPQFVQPGHWREDKPSEWVEGDYHLKSQAGRWNAALDRWVWEDETSPCIDTGDPQMPVADEPLPNGNRINMGCFGGTPYASKS